MRLFVGTLLGSSTQSFFDRFIAELVSAEPRLLRPIPKHSAHLTCVFCADVPETATEALGEAVRRVAAVQRSFLIELAPPHVLVAGRAPRLMSADLAHGAAAFLQLTEMVMREIARSCTGLDFRSTRSAHVTLARFRRGANREDAQRVTRALEHLRGHGQKREEGVHRLQIIESTLTSAQPVYDVKVDVPFSESP